MGGHAPAGAGRPVDVAEGPHEGRLEGDDAAGEEGRCVHLPARQKMSRALSYDVSGAFVEVPEVARGICATVAELP